VNALSPQKSHGLAVNGDMQFDGQVGFAERLLCQPDIAWAVFNRQNFHRPAIAFAVRHDVGSLSG
jgi:hypothetical protein